MIALRAKVARPEPVDVSVEVETLAHRPCGREQVVGLGQVEVHRDPLVAWSHRR